VGPEAGRGGDGQSHSRTGGPSLQRRQGVGRDLGLSQRIDDLEKECLELRTLIAQMEKRQGKNSKHTAQVPVHEAVKTASLREVVQ
jgi:hypothetical protein